MICLLPPKEPKRLTQESSCPAAGLELYSVGTVQTRASPGERKRNVQLWPKLVMNCPEI